MSDAHTSAREADTGGVVRVGLRGRLLWWILPLVNAVFVAIWLVSTMTARVGLESMSHANLELSSQNLADAVAQILADARADAVTTSRLDLPAQAIETGDPKNIVWYADELVSTKGRYSAIVVADEKGRIVACNSVDRDGKKTPVRVEGRSVAAHAWAGAAIKRTKGEGVWVAPSEPEFLKGVLRRGERVVGFSLPVIDILDKPIGTLTLLLSTDFLGRQLAGYLTATEGAIDSVAILVDGQGRPVVLPGELPSAEAWRAAAVPPSPGAGSHPRWRGPEGADYLLAEREVRISGGGEGWRLVAMKTAAALEAPIGLIGDRLLLAFAVAVVLTTTVLVALATRFVAPVRRLTEAARGMTRAAEYQPLTVESADEVGALTASFNRMVATVRSYEEGLEEKVAERTRELAGARQEVKDILDNMRQAIFTVGPDGLVDREFSASTKEVFGTDDISGRDALELLQVTPDRHGDAHARMRCWLDAIHGADDLQWMLAASEGLREIDLERRTEQTTELRHLQIEYAPIFEDEAVAKVMVIVDDVTEVKSLERQVSQKEAQNRQNLQRIAEIVGMAPDIFETFVAETDELLDQCGAAVTALRSDPGSAEGIDRLFRAMHTIKGNARIFKVTSIQDLAHAVEDRFAKIRDGEERCTPEAIDDVEGKVRDVRGLVRQFEGLGRQILIADSAVDGGSRGARSASLTVRVAVSRVLELRRRFKELARAMDEAGRGERYAELGDAVEALTRVPLDELFGRCRKMALDLGRELGKKLEDLTFSGGEIEVDTKLVDKMRDVTIHALRNSVDHGIEDPTVRVAAGKPERGRISVGAAWADRDLVVEIADDGAGFDVARLKRRAFEKRIRTEEELDRMTDQELVELAFLPGISTAEKLTQVSGRGVGLDVIQATMTELKGSATIRSARGEGTTLTLRIPADYYQRL